MFLQTEEPYWLDETYKSPIAIIDTGIVKRNLLFATRTSVILSVFFNKKASFLDFGGGNGLFVRMMRDIGFDFYWVDKYSKNFLANGFDASLNYKRFELVTSFECFEHFTNPLEEIKSILEYSDNILFSTQIFNNKPPNPDEWWYYNFEAGQHISLYSLNSLKLIAKIFNLNLSSDGKGFHLLSNKKYNNFIFMLLIKFSYLGLGSLVKIFSKSKTESDMELIKCMIAKKEK